MDAVPPASLHLRPWGQGTASKSIRKPHTSSSQSGDPHTPSSESEESHPAFSQSGESHAPSSQQDILTLLPANQETVTLPPVNQVTAPPATSTTLHLQFSVPGTPFFLHCLAHSVAFSRPGSAMSSSGKLCVTPGRKEEHWPSWTPKAQPHPILQAGI